MTGPPTQQAQPTGAVPVADLLRQLSSSPDGLGDAEAAERLRTAGPNLLESHRRFLLLRLLASRFRNPLIILLISPAPSRQRPATPPAPS